MKVLSRCAMVVLACALAVACMDVTAQAANGFFEVTLSTSEPVRLDVRNGSGSIAVRQGPSGEVRVIGRIQVRPRLGRGAGKAEEIVRRLEAEPPVEVSGGEVRVGHITDQELQRNVSISYQIDVPAAAEVVSRTGSGSQEITGVAGPVEARSGSGSIRLTEIAGPATATTGSGSIRAAGIAGAFDARTGSGSVTLTQTAAGDVSVATGSGSAELSGINGALRARTGSGGIRAEGEQAGRWDLEAGSGSIRVRLPADAAFDLDARTGSGSIETRHPVTVEGTVGRGRLSGQARGGGEVLYLRSGSGSIRIE